MKFSIVTISFNQAEFLEQAILSVLDQDYPDVEYIVVDPGSTDGSRDIIERYRDRIDKIIYETDLGPADGLNKGFTQATGDIYGFLNSDDVFMPGAFSAAAKVFEHFPCVDVVSGGALVVDEHGNVARRLFSDRFHIYMAAYGACILIQPSTFFKGSKFSSVGGFNVDNKSNWDAELFIDMALKGAVFKVVNSIFSQYRVHPESITGSARLHDAHSEYRERIFKRLLGRQKTFPDKVMGFLLVHLRKILNPRDTFERIMYGPVFGASK
ncbi:glycosyl transferase, family 2 [Thioalkalivibrio sulfidiphilus HL-EbGr7]|uniref:Glycosyl transferase, family 2 n=1 Tax=Thioalkalivibrio sulfidiphilus (strain HL-EbGR7) TaxID=396588 RepID=B8GTT5_THISH|nr:glycosyltransferase family 2 protein [Thioalkalivibrio sulfidiphilus]ACL73179.1 glycosyl transferase, family 2 [Thioalkalivibrio sulfidiphilus HL-EbGr7]